MLKGLKLLAAIVNLEADAREKTVSRRFVLSTVGMSLFFNTLEKNEQEWRGRFNRISNAAALSENRS